jgi:hypothetical protein
MATKQNALERVSAWNQARIAKQQEKSKAPYATVAGGVKDAFTVFCGGCLPFAILVILTISAGYYFNSLKGFTGDTQSVVAYGTAAIVECGNLALFFVSSKAFWSGKTAHFLMALLIGLALTLISVIAQVLYLSNNTDQASIGAGADLLQGLPLVGSLASTATIIVTRALALHVVEFACCYIIARSSVSHKKIMQRAIEEQSEQMMLQVGQQFIAFMQARMPGATIEAAPAEAAPIEKPANVLSLPHAPATPAAPNGHGQNGGASNGSATFRP